MSSSINIRSEKFKHWKPNHVKDHSTRGKISISDYLFDFMYDWIDRMSTELFPSLPTPPGSFVNEKNDLLSPLNTFDTKTHGKDSRRIYGQLRGYPGHSDFQISPVKRFGISKKHKVCTDVKLAPWARRLCSSLKRSA